MIACIIASTLSHIVDLFPSLFCCTGTTQPICLGRLSALYTDAVISELLTY